MSADGQVVAILSTAPKDEEAQHIARTLVSEQLAACVNILPGVRSIYRWEGEVHDDAELMLVIKTTRAQQDALVTRLSELHSYDCPEAIALPVAGGAKPYLDWVLASVGAQ